MIEVVNLNKSFGEIDVLHDINIKINKGGKFMSKKLLCFILTLCMLLQALGMVSFASEEMLTDEIILENDIQKEEYIMAQKRRNLRAERKKGGF